MELEVIYLVHYCVHCCVQVKSTEAIRRGPDWRCLKCGKPVVSIPNKRRG